MGTPTLRAALVGCGRISAYHIAAIRAVGQVEIVAVCDLRRELAADVASQHGIQNVFTDMESMMSEMAPDVVHIVTPPASHVPLAALAAKHHAHMYIEKPFATSLADAYSILEAARTAGVQVCAGHSRVFDPTFREARRRLHRGEIGDVISVRAEQGFTYEPGARSAVIPWDLTYDWGIFENLMPHPLALVCDLLEAPGEPKVVARNVGRVREAAVEELRVVIPAKNAIGEVSLSLSSPEVNRLEVVGTLGRAVVDFDSMTIVFDRESGLPSAARRFGGNFVTAFKLVRGSSAVALGVARGRIKRYMGIRALVGEFYRALLNGSPVPIPPEQALAAVRLMEQIKEASLGVAKQRIVREGAREGVAANPRILVTGASGFLGGRLVERLSREGTAVRATTRLLSRASELPNVEWIECDLARQGDVRRAVAGVETIFHCAAMAGPPGSLVDYERANVDGTISLATIAAEAGVEKLVYVSSLAVYGMPRTRASVDETAEYDTRAGDRGVYTQTKVRAERELLERVDQNATPRVVIFRPGTLYGPGAPLPVGLLELPSVKWRPIITGGRHVPVALTHVDNLIDAMIAAAETDVPTGRIYNLVDSTDVVQDEVCRTIRELSGGRIRPIVAPYAAVWLMMLGLDLLSLIRTGTVGTARFRLKRTLAPIRFSSEAARAELGWHPRVSLAEGLSQALDGAAASRPAEGGGR